MLKIFFIKHFGSQINSPLMNLNILIHHSILNRFGGVELDLEKVISPKSTKLYTEDNTRKLINCSMDQWIQNKARYVYVKIPIYLNIFIPPFLNLGFQYHHTQRNNLYLYKWLEKSENKLPMYCHHHVGIGAVIVNENLDFLLVQEKYSPSFTKSNNPWKFVTGLIEEGETIYDATKREAKEEVKLDIDFHGCLVVSDGFPNFQLANDICFFNFCSVKGKIPEQIDYEKDELVNAKFFSINEVKILLDNQEVSLATQIVFAKLLPLLDFSKSLEENISKFQNILRLNKDHNGKLSRLKHFYVYH